MSAQWTAEENTRARACLRSREDHETLFDVAMLAKAYAFGIKQYFELDRVVV